MNWLEAVEAMRAGLIVRRRSEMYTRHVRDNIFETGMEGCRLLAAWSSESQPVLVFAGAESGVMFVPDAEWHEAATDWEIVRG